MKTLALNLKVSPSGRRRGKVERTLLKIAMENGLEIVESSFEDAQLAKGISRERDMELIESGKASAEEIQSKNSVTNGPIKVINWGRRLPT